MTLSSPLRRRSALFIALFFVWNKRARFSETRTGRYWRAPWSEITFPRGGIVFAIYQSRCRTIKQRHGIRAHRSQDASGVSRDVRLRQDEISGRLDRRQTIFRHWCIFSNTWQLCEHWLFRSFVLSFGFFPADSRQSRIDMSAASLQLIESRKCLHGKIYEKKPAKWQVVQKSCSPPPPLF